jgi:hypothetical protein
MPQVRKRTKQSCPLNLAKIYNISNPPSPLRICPVLCFLYKRVTKKIFFIDKPINSFEFFFSLFRTRDLVSHRKQNIHIIIRILKQVILIFLLCIYICVCVAGILIVVSGRSHWSCETDCFEQTCRYQQTEQPRRNTSPQDTDHTFVFFPPLLYHIISFTHSLTHSLTHSRSIYSYYIRQFLFQWISNSHTHTHTHVYLFETISSG